MGPESEEDYDDRGGSIFCTRFKILDLRKKKYYKLTKRICFTLNCVSYIDES